MENPIATGEGRVVGYSILLLELRQELFHLLDGFDESSFLVD
jgi:hypothetical protein